MVNRTTLKRVHIYKPCQTIISIMKMIMTYSGLWGSANSRRQDELHLSKLCPFTYWPLSHSSVSAPPFASSSVFITLRIWIYAICSTPLQLMAFQLNEYGEKWHANVLWFVCVCVFVGREGVKVRESQEEKNARLNNMHEGANTVDWCRAAGILVCGATVTTCGVLQKLQDDLFISDTGLKVLECCNPFLLWMCNCHHYQLIIKSVVKSWHLTQLHT